MSCRKHPDMSRALEAAQERVKRLAEALDRYGRHERGCAALRRGWRYGTCTCGLHQRVLEGGVRP